MSWKMINVTLEIAQENKSRATNFQSWHRSYVSILFSVAVVEFQLLKQCACC